MANETTEHKTDAAANGEGMPVPHTGPEALTTAGHEAAETHATTEAHGGAAGHHAEPALFGVLDATVWVSIAMAVFIAVLIWKKVPGLIAGGLNKQIAAIRTRLDEAKTLRAEAEALRDEYARKIAGADADVAAMLAHAEQEAAALVAKADADTKELVKRRTKMAEDKIAAAERAAIAEVRAKAADAAARAAGALIAQRHDAGADKALVDKTIAGLGRVN